MNTIPSQNDIDPHLWLSLKNDKIIATNIYRALEKAAPQYSQYFNNNLNSLIKNLDLADRDISTLMQPYKDRIFFVFHPAFGWFARDYALLQKSIEVEGKTPNPRDLFNTLQNIKNWKIKTIFVEPEFDRTIADSLAKMLGANVVTVSPLAENIPQNLLDVAEKIKESFQPNPPPSVTKKRSNRCSE